MDLKYTNRHYFHGNEDDDSEDECDDDHPYDEDEDEEDSDADHDGAEDEDEPNANFQNADDIRSELSTMSMEDILKMKSKLGKKVYCEVVLGKKCTESGNTRWPNSFKRANKNRPREMSSKRPGPQSHGLIVKKAIQRRDPRFEETAGKFNETIFKSTYKFLDDMKTNERKKLTKELKKERDPKRRKQIEYLIQRHDNQMRVEQMKTKKISHMKTLQNERKTELQGITKTSKDDDEHKQRPVKPIYVNKSKVKKLELVEKFKELKKSGKLDRYIEKKRKRNMAKDRKHINMEM